MKHSPSLLDNKGFGDRRSQEGSMHLLSGVKEQPVAQSHAILTGLANRPVESSSAASLQVPAGCEVTSVASAHKESCSEVLKAGNH